MYNKLVYMVIILECHGLLSVVSILSICQVVIL